MFMSCESGVHCTVDAAGLIMMMMCVRLIRQRPVHCCVVILVAVYSVRCVEMMDVDDVTYCDSALIQVPSFRLSLLMCLFSSALRLTCYDIMLITCESSN